MRDEDGPLLGELRALNADQGVGDDHPHQGCDVGARHVEREQGRDGIAHGVPERFEPGEALAFGAPASGHNHPIEALAVQGEAALREGSEFLNRGLEADVDAALIRLVEQAINDGLGRVGGGEHASVRLGFEGHASGLEPRHRVGRLKRPQRLFQLFATAGVVFGQGGRGEAMVGDVASSATGDFDLRQEFGRLFEEHNLRGRVMLRRRQCREKTRCASANHCHLPCSIHGRKLVHKARGLVS